jgi:DNA-3-methyladenine glycosylase
VKRVDEPGVGRGASFLIARIVESEAYQEDDPASHSFGGPRGRNAVMFGPAGRLYVYFTYGMHFCMNVVTGSDGEGSAVLLRAAEPVEGLEAMATRRGVTDPRLLCSGPARLTEAFGVGRQQNGMELTRASGLWLASGRPVPDHEVVAGPRIGIRLATERPWRFSIRADPWVSRPAPGQARASATGAAARAARPPR